MATRKPPANDASQLRFKQELRDGLGKLYVFHGKEDYLKEHYLSQVKKALVPPGLEQFNLRLLSGKDCGVEELAEALDCPPSFGGRVLIVARDFDLFANAEVRKEMAKLLSGLPEDCCLLFYYDLLPYKPDNRTEVAAALSQNGLVVEFDRLERGKLAGWIVRHFNALGHDLSIRDGEYLIDLCGDSMGNLRTEIEKIAAYAPRRQVTREDIDQVAIPQIDAVVFRMTDAMAQGNFEQAAGVLSDLLGAREPAIKILAAVGKYFRQLYTARLLVERRGNTTALMEMWNLKSSWQAERLLTAARRYSLPWCRQAVARCARADLAMKSGGAERDVLVTLLLELANAGRTP